MFMCRGILAHLVFTPLVFIVFFLGCTSKPAQIPVRAVSEPAFSTEKELTEIRTSSKTVDVLIGSSDNKISWIVDPSIPRDVLTVACKEGPTEVRFVTDLESIRFSLEPNIEQEFFILLPDGSRALTVLRGIRFTEPARFNTDYINQHRGNYAIKIPEVQELVQVIMTLTPSGRDMKNLIKQGTPYYESVLSHFYTYSHEPIVAEIETRLKNGHYANLKMDSNAFEFRGDRIVRSEVFDRLSWEEENTLLDLVSNLEEFARVSQFRKFYAANQELYLAEIDKTEQQMPIRKMWNWLETHFDTKHDSYLIFISPLVFASHSTNHFENNGFSQTAMFICSAIDMPEFNPQVQIGINSRIVFTEIDHNYVNPVTDRYLDQINRIFMDRAKWVGKRQSGYGPPSSVFGEYMTWAVFSLYCLDTFEPADFETIIEDLETFMGESGRGFIRFKEFNQKLLSLYRQKPNTKIEELYPAILEWTESISSATH